MVLMQKAIKLGLPGVFLNFLYKFKSIFRFLVVGCLNTAVDFLSFTLLYSLFGMDKLICQAAGYGMGTANSFVLNKLWTFENKSSRPVIAGQIVRFAAVNAISLGISLLALKFFSEYCGLNVYLSKILATCASQGVNYSGYKLWVFR